VDAELWERLDRGAGWLFRVRRFCLCPLLLALVAYDFPNGIAAHSDEKTYKSIDEYRGVGLKERTYMEIVTKSVPRVFSVKKQIFFTIIILAVFLVLTEGAIRAWALYFRTSYEQYNRQSGRLELVPNIQYLEANGREFRINSRGFVGPDFDPLPPSGVTRVMAVGDSCTFTVGQWEIAYPAVAERQMNVGGAHRRYEYINAGIEGYNSSFALARIKEELLQYRPHVVTIYIGWNDLMKQNPENQAEVARPSLIAEVINESYLVKAYKKIIFVYLRPLLFEPKVQPDDADRHAYDHYTPKLYENNLRSMIRELEAHGVQAVLFTLPTILESGLTAQDLKSRNVFFPYYAGSFSVERLLSLHAAYNRTIRAVGQDEHVPVLDLDEKFNKQNKRQLFWDTMHPSEKGNALIAREVAEMLVALLEQ
jgi:lysophospholipase L1-like esterase